MVNQLHQLVSLRDSLLEEEDETKRDETQIDALAAEITQIITEHQDTLPVEVMLESLTKLGAAPSILYDDNGHFTIGGDGFQNLPDVELYETQETVFGGEWMVPAGHWKPTIREALRVYLKDRET